MSNDDMEADDLNRDFEGELRREEHDYQDLMNDFNFIKELNRELSEKYADLLSAFPLAKEVELIIQYYNERNDETTSLTELEENKKRQFQLKRLKSACVMLEKQDPTMKPPKYEDLET